MAVISCALSTGNANAQSDDADNSDNAIQDVIVVTGSAIRGTPEDAALPVNVYSADDLELQGDPSGLDFAKSLTQSGPTAGESYYFSGGPTIGAPRFNLRGLGTDKTLTLMNGRRVSGNISNIPGIALGRTEVLKDGAAVIYGADAVGGVVNFITKENFVGAETKADYKYVDGSDGEWDLGVLYGFGEDDTNIIVSAEWEHRSRLETEERDFASLPFAENPIPWSFLTNLANYLPVTAGGTPLFTPISDFTQSTCEEQGGVFSASTPGGASCSYNYAPFYNLVEDQDTFKLFAQIDTVVSDNVNFHADASWAEVQVPHQFNSPSLPTTQGPGTGTGATFQYSVPTTNPFIAEFATRSGYAATGRLPITDRFDVILLRPFAHQGNPVLGRGEGNSNAARSNIQIWRTSASIDGVLGETFGPLEDIGFDFGVTYNQENFDYQDADVIGYRLQEALNGFGGPGCNAEDLDSSTLGTQNAAAAGQNGCLWYNPFSTSYAGNPETGATNPNYVAGSENPDELISWLFDPLYIETITSSLTLDMVFNGTAPIELPGGTIAWAAGSQWRQLEEREIVPSELYNGATPCAWPEGQRPLANDDPEFNGCTLNEPGPFGFRGTNVPDYNDQQSIAFFGEVSLPLHDRLNVQAAVRREEFDGDIGATVYKVSGKWDVWGPLSFRGSYGTNFQAPPISLRPGFNEAVVRSFDAQNGAWLAGQRITRSDVEAEEAESLNVGVIWNSEGFAPDHAFTFTADYFDIETKGAIDELATPNQIANAVFFLDENEDGVADRIPDLEPGDPGYDPLLADRADELLANCASPFIDRIILNNAASSPDGTCVQGFTGASSLNTAITEIGNGHNEITSGIDFDATYDMPVWEGDLTLNVAGTYLLEFERTARILDGVEVAPADDRLGFVNFESIPFPHSEWRVNFSANYNWDQHNTRFMARYVSGLEDERASLIPVGVLPGTSTPYPAITNGAKVDDPLLFDLTYVYDYSDNWRFTANITNLLDTDPPFIWTEFGYDPRIADALGRTIEIGVKASF